MSRTSRIVVLLIAAALIITGLGAARADTEPPRSARVVGPNAPWTPSPPITTRPTDQRPNIVWILLDDMRADELRWMPKTRRLLVRNGTSYTNAISPHPVCCPARAEMLTGQYAQNSGVLHNQGPRGGYKALRNKSRTVGSWMKSGGYQGYFIGKYLNGYASTPRATWRERAQWTRFDAAIKGTYGYGLIPMKFANGDVVKGSYITRTTTGRTNATLARFAKPGTPFFLWINHLAPHPGELEGGRRTLPKPEAKYRGLYPNATPPSIRWPSYNRLVKGDDTFGEWSHHQSVGEVTYRFKARIRSLRSVDDSVGALVRTLRDRGELANTYFVLTSDNGYQLGEHGLNGKNTLYKESMDVPLVVRGPGIARGAKVSTPVTLLDVVASTAKWSGVAPTRRIDGLPLDQVAGRRDTILIQLGDGRRDSTPGWQYRGVQTGRYTFAMVAGHPGRGVLIDNRRDPFQVRNQWKNPAYAAVRRELARRTRILQTCSGAASCNRNFGPLPTVG